MFKVNDHVLVCTRRGVSRGVVTHIDSRCDDVVIAWYPTGSSGHIVHSKNNEIVEHLTQFDISRRGIRLDDDYETCNNCKYRLYALTASCPSDRFIASQQEERIIEDAGAGRID